jgi:hypothetical protein
VLYAAGPVLNDIDALLRPGREAAYTPDGLALITRYDRAAGAALEALYRAMLKRAELEAAGACRTCEAPLEGGQCPYEKLIRDQSNPGTDAHPQRT